MDEIALKAMELLYKVPPLGALEGLAELLKDSRIHI